MSRQLYARQGDGGDTICYWAVRLLDLKLACAFGPNQSRPLRVGSSRASPIRKWERELYGGNLASACDLGDPLAELVPTVSRMPLSSKKEATTAA